MRKVYFYLPDFYVNFHLIITLDDMMKKSPELFFDDIKIGAAYGCFPGSIWNGGRVVLGSFLYYLVKPEHRDEMRLYLLRKLYK